MRELIQDIRYSLRTMRSHPGFTAVAVIALAIGIGANSAIFSVVNSLMLRPLPFHDPDKLVQVWEWEIKRGYTEETVAYPNFADWRAQNHVFEHIAAYTDVTFTLTGRGEPEIIQGARVSPALFPLLGITPILGRVLSEDEDYPNIMYTAVMGERLWRQRFNSDPHIVGQTVNLNNASFTVSGVIPDIADLAGMPDATELWVSIAHSRAFDNRRGHYLDVVARLKPGVTRDQAQANMDAVASALEKQHPISNTDHHVRLVSLREQIVGDFKPALLVLLGAVACVLLIASANVANMLLAQAAGRRKEIAIRTALGAGRLRIVRQMLTESVMLSAAGGAAGLLLAVCGVYLIVAFGPADLPRAKEIGVDIRVLGFTLAISLLTGILFGLVPALQASRPGLNESLKEGGRAPAAGSGHRRARSALVVAEIALSFVLLIGAGLLIRSFVNLQSVNPGFTSHNLVATTINLRGPAYQAEEPVVSFYDQLLGQLKGTPGVQGAAIRSHIPIATDEGYAYLSFSIEGRESDPAHRPLAYYNAVSPDFFQTMGIPLLEGRSFDEHDVPKMRNVSIINEALAQRYFSGADPVGKRISLKDENQAEEDWTTIVGVVKDTKPRELYQAPAAELYMPFAQQPKSSMALLIRTTDSPGVIAGFLRPIVRSLDKNLPAGAIRTMDSVVSESVSAQRFRTYLLGVLALAALILAMVGIYGVMSYSVSQRTHEIGVRMALGARARDMLGLVLGNGLTLTLAGIGIGLSASFALTRLMANLLFGVEPADPLTFAGVAVLLALVALFACFVPARRATKVDPMVALRCD